MLTRPRPHILSKNSGLIQTLLGGRPLQLYRFLKFFLQWIDSNACKPILCRHRVASHGVFLSARGQDQNAKKAPLHGPAAARGRPQIVQRFRERYSQYVYRKVYVSLQRKEKKENKKVFRPP